ncbi:MAG: hypothetical protein KDA96_20190, partial [Planctomycetaceae bacterium]|nr:hypothetical protein [Planctomycetaceae bacterium]
MKSPHNSEHALIRRGFLRLSAGIIGGLGIPGALNVAATVPVRTAKSATLDESYLEKGLTGMARSKGWFNAHLGAA